MTNNRDGSSTTPGRGLSMREISEFFDIAGRETEVIAGLSGGMDQLRAVQVAKHALATLSPAEVRAAMEYRRTITTPAPQLSDPSDTGLPARSSS